MRPPVLFLELSLVYFDIYCDVYFCLRDIHDFRILLQEYQLYAQA